MQTYEVPAVAFIIPCYNETDVLPLTIRTLQSLLMQWKKERLIARDSFVLFVDDGSKDATWTCITSIHGQDDQFHGLKLAHNVGHQQALFGGLKESRTQAECFISLDADLQDDLSIVPAFLEQFQGGHDIVYGVRADRSSDSWFKRTSAEGFYRVMSGLGVETIPDHADYRLMSRRAVETLCDFPERNLFLRGIVPTLGFKTTMVSYQRQRRQAGESKYPLRKMLQLAWDGITSFSVRPIKLLFLISVLMLIVSIGFVGYAFYLEMIGETINGWTSLMMSIWFIGGLQLFGIGLIGEYIGKIYQEVKRRPRYVVEEKRQ